MPMLAKVQLKRLQNLIVALEDAKPEDFDMEKFANQCGTPACVLGHYASRRDLQKTFKLRLDPKFGEGLIKGRDGHSLGIYDRLVLDHFGLTFQEAYDLLSTDGCDGAQTPKQAIKYIKRFIGRKTKDKGKS